MNNMIAEGGPEQADLDLYSTMGLFRDGIFMSAKRLSMLIYGDPFSHNIENPREAAHVDLLGHHSTQTDTTPSRQER